MLGYFGNQSSEHGEIKRTPESEEQSWKLYTKASLNKLISAVA